MKMILIAVLLLIATSCSSERLEEPSTILESGLKIVTLGKGIQRLVDYDTKVVCWRVYTGGQGIDCIPFNQLNIGVNP